MNVENIVNEYLKANGYDGIYNENGECSCLINDLCPCSGPMDQCYPGVRVPCDCGDHDYHIVKREGTDMKVGIRVGKRKKFDVDAVYFNKDWAVTNKLYSDIDDPLKFNSDPDLYQVTHIPSGYALPLKDNLWSKETAIRLVDKMSACRAKWNGKGKPPSKFTDEVKPMWRQLKKEEGLT